MTATTPPDPDNLDADETAGAVDESREHIERVGDDGTEVIERTERHRADDSDDDDSDEETENR